MELSLMPPASSAVGSTPADEEGLIRLLESYGASGVESPAPRIERPRFEALGSIGDEVDGETHRAPFFERSR